MALSAVFNSSNESSISSTGVVASPVSASLLCASLISFAIFIVSYLPTIMMRRNVVISNALYTIIVLTILFSMGGGFIFRFYQIKLVLIKSNLSRSMLVLYIKLLIIP